MILARDTYYILFITIVYHYFFYLSDHVSNKGLFSYGDGSTTFRLPDYRDIFIRGLDNGRGYDPNRVLGTEQLPTLIPGYDDNQKVDGTKTDLTLGYIASGYNASSDNLKNSDQWEYGYRSSIGATEQIPGNIGDYNIGYNLLREYTYPIDNTTFQHEGFYKYIFPYNVDKDQAVRVYAASRPRNIALNVYIKYN